MAHLSASCMSPWVIPDYYHTHGWPKKVFEDAEAGNEVAIQYIPATFPLQS